MIVATFFDNDSSTFSYILHAGVGAPCAIIDPVLDYDPAAARTHTASAQKLVDYVRQHGLTLQWMIETHAHADHLSGAPWLKQQLGGHIVIGQPITVVQKTFSEIFNWPHMATDGRPFDRLVADGESIHLGDVRIEAHHVPGHTPADMAWHVHLPEGKADWVFVGDTLFAPDAGTARCDFPGGDARQLYRSVRRLLTLPPDTRIFLCHNYADGVAEAPARFCEHTVAEHRLHNIHVKDGMGEDEFVAMRRARDATLAMPRLIWPAVQVNIRAGQWPDPEDNGTRYLKIPLNVLDAPGEA